MLGVLYLPCYILASVLNTWFLHVSQQSNCCHSNTAIKYAPTIIIMDGGCLHLNVHHNNVCTCFWPRTRQEALNLLFVRIPMGSRTQTHIRSREFCCANLERIRRFCCANHGCTQSHKQTTAIRSNNYKTHDESRTQSSSTVRGTWN